MQAQQLTVAIVGAGLMGRWHAHSVKKLSGIITAVVDSNLPSAKKLGAQAGGIAFASLDDALAKVDFDVVHICTPVGSHVVLARQALLLNKHVIIEKPIALSAMEVAELQALAASRNLLLCPVHQFAFQRGVQRAKKVLKKRQNKPLAVAFDFASAGGAGRSEDQLNQILIEILPHPLSILSEIWSDSVLQSEFWNVDNPRAGELFAYGRHSDIPVSIKLSLHARPTHCYMTIYHDSGAIHVNLFHGFAVFESPVVSRVSKMASPFTLSLKTLYAAGVNLLQRLFAGETAYPGLCSLIEGCYRSIQTAEPAPLSNNSNLAVSKVCDLFAEKLNSDFQLR